MEYYGDREVDEISPDRVKFITSFVLMTAIFMSISSVNYIDIFTMDLLIATCSYFKTKNPNETFMLQFFGTFCTLSSYVPSSIYVSLPLVSFFVSWWIIWYGFHRYPHPSNFLLNYFIFFLINYFFEGGERIFTSLTLFWAIVDYLNGFRQKSLVDFQLLVLLFWILIALNDDRWPSLIMFMSHVFFTLWTFLKSYMMR